MSGVATGLRRNLSMTIALIITTAISIALVGASLLVRLEVSKFRQQYEYRLNVQVYLADTITPEQQNSLRQQLEADPVVDGVSYVSLEDALVKGKQLSPDSAPFIELGDLPASFTVRLKDQVKNYTEFAKRYATAAGVSQVQNQDEALKKLLLLFDRIKLAVLAVAALIVVAAFILLFNAVQLAANHRRTETGIMRLVGASRLMVELPFVIEAMLATLVGAVLALILAAVGNTAILGAVFGEQIKQGVIPGLDFNDVLINAGLSGLAAIVLAGVTAFATLRWAVRI